VHFGVHFIVDVRDRPCTGNLPSAYKHLSSKSSRTVRIRRAGPKTFVYTRVANLGDFSPKKGKFGDSFEKCSGQF
jgi:hypothetical protein